MFISYLSVHNWFGIWIPYFLLAWQEQLWVYLPTNRSGAHRQHMQPRGQCWKAQTIFLPGSKVNALTDCKVDSHQDVKESAPTHHTFFTLKLWYFHPVISEGILKFYSSVVILLLCTGNQGEKLLEYNTLTFCLKIIVIHGLWFKRSFSKIRIRAKSLMYIFAGPYVLLELKITANISSGYRKLFL